MTNIIVDGNNLLHRSISKTEKWLDYNNNKSRKINKEGLDVTSLQKFLFDLYYSTCDFHETESRIYVVWDRKIDKTATNWRKDINPLYKANRDSIEDSPQKQQVHLLCKHIKHILDVMGIYSVYPLSSEGDDIMFYLKNNLKGKSVLVSADQDFYQCVSEDCVVYNPQKRLTIDLDNFKEVTTVSIENFVRFKSIKGDPSDNLKGLYRYGEVKAKKLVENWEEESVKLDEEQLQILKDTEKLIDLSWKPLSPKEVKVIEKQTEKVKEKANDWDLTKVFDKYSISHSARIEWDKYFDMKEFSFE